MNVIDLVKAWGWEEPDDAPNWLNTLADEYTDFTERKLRMGEILVERGLAKKADIEHWLRTKSDREQMGTFLQNDKNVPARVRNNVVPAIAATESYLLPFFDSLIDKEGVQIAPPLYANDSIQKECVDINAVLLKIASNDNYILVFATLDGYEKYKHRPMVERVESAIEKEVGRVYFGVSNNQIVADVLRDINSGKQVSEVDSFDLIESEMMSSGDPIQNAIALMFNAIIQNGGSDLHIAPQLKNDTVHVKGRFKTRLKMLGTEHQIDRQLYYGVRDYLVAKTQATQHRAPVFVPVDGAALTYHRKNGEKVRLRPSFMPVGIDTIPEKNAVRTVFRFSALDADVRRVRDLNLHPKAKELFMAMCSSKGKMAVMVGPMGSGKTTTMYAGLQAILDLSQGSQLIASVEDPIEAVIEGVDQIQISYQARQNKLGYDHYLKSFVRQDTNVLYLGEIRDRETAETAGQFSAIGNKILTTIHGANEMEGLSRLMTMLRRKDDQFLLASNLSYVFTQRIVPVLCDHCKIEIEVTPDMRYSIMKVVGPKAGVEFEKIQKKIPGKAFAAGEGECGHCSGDRYTSVRPVLGVLTITPEVRKLMLSDDVNREEEIAKLRDITMYDQVLEMIVEGETDIKALDL